VPAEVTFRHGRPENDRCRRPTRSWQSSWMR
jgi:hypothetical protein